MWWQKRSHKRGGNDDGEARFIASWLVDYPWLVCSQNYTIAEQEIEPALPTEKRHKRRGKTAYGASHKVKRQSYVLAPPEALWKCVCCTDGSISQLGALSNNDFLSTCGVRHGSVRHCDKMSKHGTDKKHLHLYSMYMAITLGDGSHKGLPMKLNTKMLSTDDELLAKFFVNVYYTSRWEGSLTNVEGSRQLCMYHGVQMPKKLTAHYMVVEIVQAWADIYREEQNQRVAKNENVFGCNGDGSTDVAGTEWEVIGLCIMDDDGKPTNEFFELEEVDLESSKDHESPDAQALMCTYGNAFQRRLPHLADFSKTGKTWTDHVPGMSLDGASVTLGSMRGWVRN